MDDPRHSTFSAASDAGSVTGSFTGSLDGQQSQPQGQQPKGGKKRGRKSKAEKEREREREDALSRSGLGGGSAGGGFRGSEARVGSVDIDGGSSVRTGPAGGGPGGGGGGNPEDAEDEEDFDDEGELLGREEGATDIEAEKKNLAYVSLLDIWIALGDANLMAQIIGGRIQPATIGTIRSVQTSQVTERNLASYCQPRALSIGACQCGDYYQRVH